MPHSQLNLPPSPLETLRSGSQPAVKSLRTWQENVRRAMGRAGLSAKAMAAEMGTSESQLSDQLHGRPNCHLSLWRMFNLPPEFWQEMVILILDFHGLSAPGLSAVDQEDMRIGRLMREIVQRSAAR